MFSFFALGWLLSACNVYRYVSGNDYLYKGASIEIGDKLDKKKYTSLKKDLETLLRPKPNSTTLGVPLALGLYSISKPPTGKGINYLLHEKWGEVPVLYSQVNEKALRERLLNKMYNEGYLHASVVDSSYSTGTLDSANKSKRNAYSRFVIKPGIRYVIDSINFPDDSTAIFKAIQTTAKTSLLKKGNPFTLELAVAERARIDKELRNKGFFYSSPDHILLRADTSEDGLVKVDVVEKKSIAPESKQIYTIGKLHLFSDYSTDNDSLLSMYSGVQRNGFVQIDPEMKFKPKLFSDNVLLREGKNYSLSDHEKTLKRMINLNEFKFINIFFKPVDSAQIPTLDVSLLLTPYPARSLQFEVGAYSKSNNFVGTEGKIKLLNRNLFHGAERFELNVSAGFEKQVGGSEGFGNTNINQTTSIDFYTPRIWVPFKLHLAKLDFVPKTKITLAAEFLHKDQLYTISSFLVKYGYTWKKKENTENQLNPFVINLVQPTYISAAYDSSLNNDPALKRSFEKQFIVGSDFSIRHNNLGHKNKVANFSNSFTVGLSGNLMGLLIPPSSDSGGIKKIGNIPFAQYVLLSNDLRMYVGKNGRKTSWVNRLFTGYGYSYGNNQALPVVKQFFIGGSSSLRAFRNGTLGPGSYYDSALQAQANQSADIKIEFNSEIRFKLMKYLSTAAFIDAGNIWMRKEVVQQPGSGFSKNWYKEIAVGTGAGLRIDASILVVRFDVAFPLRKPYLPDGQRWVVDEIKLGDSDWRKQNLILNVAIGYPF